MLLKDYLNGHTKEQLLDYARDFELKNCSGLRKAALVERIMEYFCSEEILRSRIVCLTEEEMNIFRRACDAPQNISEKEIFAAMQLFLYQLGGFEETSDCFTIYEEIANIFKRIDDETFRAEQSKKGWLMKCVHFFITYYGMAPLEVMYELYRLKAEDTIDDMIAMLNEMPLDIVESGIFTMERLGLEDWTKNHPVYSDRGVLVHIPLLEDEEIVYLLSQQRDKQFYIPSAKQIDEIYVLGYEADSPAYKKLEAFFVEKMGIPHEEAASWCFQICVDNYKGESPVNVINKMSEEGIMLKNQEQAREIIELLVNAHNSTRMKENRGHAPDEIAISA